MLLVFRPSSQSVSRFYSSCLLGNSSSLALASTPAPSIIDTINYSIYALIIDTINL